MREEDTNSCVALPQELQSKRTEKDYLQEREKLFSELFAKLGNKGVSSQETGINGKKGIFWNLFKKNSPTENRYALLPKGYSENQIEDESFAVDIRINKFWHVISILLLLTSIFLLESCYLLVLKGNVFVFCILVSLSAVMTILVSILLRGMQALADDMFAFRRGKYVFLYLIMLGWTLYLCGSRGPLPFMLSALLVMY